jgi:hypothetical protein
LYLAEIADRVAKSESNPGLAKKLHVLAALEIERHRRLTTDTSNAHGANVANSTAATLDTLMMTSLETQVLIEFLCCCVQLRYRDLFQREQLLQALTLGEALQRIITSCLHKLSSPKVNFLLLPCMRSHMFRFH